MRKKRIRQLNQMLRRACRLLGYNVFLDQFGYNKDRRLHHSFRIAAKRQRISVFRAYSSEASCSQPTPKGAALDLFGDVSRSSTGSGNILPR